MAKEGSQDVMLIVLLVRIVSEVSLLLTLGASCCPGYVWVQASAACAAGAAKQAARCGDQPEQLMVNSEPTPPASYAALRQLAPVICRRLRRPGRTTQLAKAAAVPAHTHHRWPRQGHACKVYGGAPPLALTDMPYRSPLLNVCH